MPEPNLLQTLEKLAKGQGDHREIVASFEDGSEFHGWTKMRIDKATISLLHSARGNHDPRTYQGVLTRAEAQRLAHLVLKTKLWTVSPSERPGVPGETRPRIVVGLASGPKIQLQGWAGDLAKHPAFAKVRTDLLSIAARISDGKVTY